MLFSISLGDPALVEREKGTTPVEVLIGIIERSFMEESWIVLSWEGDGMQATFHTGNGAPAGTIFVKLLWEVSLWVGNVELFVEVPTSCNIVYLVF